MKQKLLDLKAGDFIARDTRLAWVWLVIRIYVGWLWLSAGWEKVQSPAWVGEGAGTAVAGYVNNSLTLTSGEHPAVLGWYASFLEGFVLPNVELFSYLVTYGEIAVGLALIFGFLTGAAAGFGAVMNLSYMLAGSAGLNPMMFVLQILLIIAWRTAGWVGLDRYVLPKLIAADKRKRFFV